MLIYILAWFGWVWFGLANLAATACDWYRRPTYCGTFHWNRQTLRPCWPSRGSSCLCCAVSRPPTRCDTPLLQVLRPSVRLSVRLSVRMSVRPSVRPSACLPIRLFASLLACVCVDMYVYVYVYVYCERVCVCGHVCEGVFLTSKGHRGARVLARDRASSRLAASGMQRCVGAGGAWRQGLCCSSLHMQQGKG